MAETEATAVANLALATVDPRKVGETPFLIVPEGAEVANLENMLPAPTRRRGNATLCTTAAFVAYVKRYAKAGTTALFADHTVPAIDAVMNYHDDSGSPGWGDFRARLALEWSHQFKAWKGYNGKRSSQMEFARFIEEHRADIVSPDGATMLEVAQSLEVYKSVEFKSAQRLQDGMRQFKYVETANGTTAGVLQVPEQFTLGLPIFVGGAPYQVTALLRYRIDDGKLSMWFDLHMLDVILDAAFSDVEGEVATGTAMTVLRGKPA